MNRQLPILFLSSILTVFLTSSCTSNEIGSSKDVNQDAIYFDYKIWGQEYINNISVMLQFRFGGANGTTLLLEEPSKVELDGEKIAADSSKMTGAFYEVLKPVKNFSGHHTIVFTDLDRKEYKEEFDFQPIALRTTVPNIIKRGDLVFELGGLDPVDYVRVVLTDTSFESEGINRVDTVRNGRIMLSRRDLRNVVNGPVTIELYKEEEKPLKKVTKEGGKLSITYGLKREFILKPGPLQ